MDKQELIKELNSPELYILKTFLEKEGVYDAFIKEYSGVVVPDCNNTQTVSLKNYDIEEIFNASFYWKRTKQGYDFWNDINNKWLSFYAKYEGVPSSLDI